MTERVAVVAASALPVGIYMAGSGATGTPAEADRVVPLVSAALRQAGITSGDVNSAVFTASSPATRQAGLLSQLPARLGMQLSSQLLEVGAMGSTGGAALDVAAAEVALGRAEFSLAIGLCLQANEKPAVAMERSVRVVGDVDFQAPFGFTPISWYALGASRYIHETGATREQIAAVAVNARAWAKDNPLAQFRHALTLEDVLAGDMVVDPLGRFEVPMQADGAVCLVLTRVENAKSLGVPFIEIIGRGFGHDGAHQVSDSSDADITDFPSARDAVRKAVGEAHLTLADIDLFELYAPCTITEVLVAESIGLFSRGEGAIAAAEGITAPGGSIALNPSGGCLARGHPPPVTGLYSVVECFLQLTGLAESRQLSKPQHALTLCEFGYYNGALAHVFCGGSW